MPTMEDFEELEAYYDGAKEDIDKRIQEIIGDEEDVHLKRRALEHMTRGGKRLRPVLTLMVADLYGAPYDKSLNHASIVELIHDASLAADDAFDGDESRRKQSSFWKVVDRLPLGGFADKVGVGASIVGGNGLVALAFQVAEDPDVLQAMSKSVSQLVDGFFLEGQSVFGGVVSGGYERYIEINKAKTGGLFALSTWLPVTYVDADDEDIETARKYGETIGILYQVTDDYVDGDLPSYVRDPAEEITKWHDEAVSYVDEMPEGEERDLLSTAPAWVVYRLLEQEDALDDLDLEFLPTGGE